MQGHLVCCRIMWAVHGRHMGIFAPVIVHGRHMGIFASVVVHGSHMGIFASVVVGAYRYIVYIS